jgi:phosphate uptake regulator
MERRKITGLGKSSLVVTLPKTWLKMNALERGDMVSMIVQNDGSLLVYPAEDASEERREIHLLIEARETDESITRRIIGAHLNGYKAIKLTSETNFTAEQQAVIRRMAGILYLMIMESEASSIVLNSLIDETQASVRSTIERMHAITCAMSRDAVRALMEWDEGLARSVASLEDDVDQLMFFLLRLIRGAAQTPALGKQLGLTPLDCLGYQTLVHRIERVADHVTQIAESTIALIRSGVDLPHEVISTFENTAEIAYKTYDSAVQLFLTKTIEGTNVIIDQQDAINILMDVITPLPRIQSDNPSTTYTHIINIREGIKRISHYTADIAEITIDRTYEMDSLHPRRQ